MFPTRCSSKEEFFKALKYATIYTSTVSLYPTSSEKTNVIVSRNRRIGVSLSGISDWINTFGNAKCVRWLREGYKVVKECNRITNEQAGVPPSIRLTCVKPSGTISQLVGCSPGMHHPTSTYAIRRIIIDKSHPVVPLLKNANYRFEPQIKYVKNDEVGNSVVMKQYLSNSTRGDFIPVENTNTYVFEFPIYLGKSRPANTVSAWEQFSQLAMLQREWSDNSVSCTVYFNPETEGEQLELMLAQFVPLIKSVSMLPLKDSSIYPQVPYQEVTEEQYLFRVKELKPIDWSSYSGSDGENELYCSNDTCTI